MRLHWSFLLPAIVELLALRPAAGQPLEVSTNPTPENVADNPWSPAPIVYLTNRGNHPVEISVFVGQPAFTIEPESAEPQSAAAAASCGNNYEPYRLLPGQTKSFHLWDDRRWRHSAGRYRVRLDYSVLSPQGPRSAVARSAPFELRLGATRPDGWREGAAPGEVVVIGSFFTAFASPADEKADPNLRPPRDSVLAEVRRCVNEAQKRLPWLRGQFGLAFYTTQKEQSWHKHAARWSEAASSSYNETELQHSTLGDEGVHTCLSEVRLAKPVLHGAFHVNFALTPAASPPGPSRSPSSSPP